jgi:hypothetical protein
MVVFLHPMAKRQNLSQPGSGLKINVLSNIAIDGAMRVMTYFKTINSRLFIMNMRQLIRSSNGHKVFLIVFLP